MDNISTEELLTDIKWTELEIEAYQKISEGYLLLCNLPEARCDPFVSRKYSFEYEKFKFFKEECKKLLFDLKELYANQANHQEMH